MLIKPSARPQVVLVLGFSLNKTKAAIVLNMITPIFNVGITDDLSSPEFSKAPSKKYKEAKLVTPKITPPIKSLTFKGCLC